MQILKFEKENKNFVSDAYGNISTGLYNCCADILESNQTSSYIINSDTGCIYYLFKYDNCIKMNAVYKNKITETYVLYPDGIVDFRTT